MLADLRSQGWGGHDPRMVFTLPGLGTILNVA